MWGYAMLMFFCDLPPCVVSMCGCTCLCVKSQDSVVRGAGAGHGFGVSNGPWLLKFQSCVWLMYQCWRVTPLFCRVETRFCFRVCARTCGCGQSGYWLGGLSVCIMLLLCTLLSSCQPSSSPPSSTSDRCTPQCEPGLAAHPLHSLIRALL